ncbi:hypothetical protein O6H91_Y071900 [Diphasiastrum complanatum]|nr:hypothetical protein O6H91_Y071900 [Diphasiastrum complanatum]
MCEACVGVVQYLLAASASSFLILERLCVIRDHLRRMAASDGFEEFGGRTANAIHFQATMFGEEFWTQLDELVKVLRVPCATPSRQRGVSYTSSWTILVTCF